ncbi:MAG: phosphate ABC transporter ATP-binding protein PstB [Firmicutes bacterium]|nr:phosphate ABC transporter ATP-binding protein PstB [Bacillota bacterium]
MKNTCIYTQDLNVHYANLHALKNVNLKIAQNEITALIGPSGCGKSTILRCFNRMNDLIGGCKVTGKVFIDEVDIYGNINVNALRKKVGMVFQKPNVFPMTIYDNVAFGPRTHGVKKRAELDRIVTESLTDAGLWDEAKDRLNKSALALSGGQQQRVCIARALAVNPQILLMDEPTSALDPISMSIIEELLSELKQKYTIVIVTHNIQQAARISDKTAFFLLGQMLEFGKTDTLLSSPKDEKLCQYISGRFG